MSKAMDKFLNKLIDDHPQSTPEVQIVFVPGTGANAGGLRRVKGMDGIYELRSFAAPGNIAPQQLKQTDLVMVSMYFESDAVQRVIQQAEEPMVKPVHAPLITPARS